MSIAIAILGITGKMGERIAAAAEKDPDITIAGGTSRHQPIGDLLTKSSVGIDFSARDATVSNVHAAQAAKTALVIGTTGLSSEDMHCIEQAAQDIPIVMSANFSIGISLCLKAISLFAHSLFGSCYIDIIETHHAHKKDAPSGTALACAEAIGSGHVVTNAPKRDKQDIVIHSLRSGNVVGEHRIIFECAHERLELIHTAHARDAFAHGALLAAKALIGKPAGLYSLEQLFATT